VYRRRIGTADRDLGWRAVARTGRNWRHSLLCEISWQGGRPRGPVPPTRHGSPRQAWTPSRTTTETSAAQL